MGIVMWDKPPKVRTTSEHNAMFTSDSGVAGTYVPNMDREFQNVWKGTIVGKTTDSPQVELRKTFGGSQLLIIVSLGNGYKYGYYDRVMTKGINIHMSCNGALQMTFTQMKEIDAAVEEAKSKLYELAPEVKPNV